MSKDLRHYQSMSMGGDDDDVMHITAFVGGKWGYGVQFTIGGKYCALAENQTRDLIKVLGKRIASKKGWKATEWERAYNQRTVEPREKRVRIKKVAPLVE